MSSFMKNQFIIINNFILVVSSASVNSQVYFVSQNEHAIGHCWSLRKKDGVPVLANVAETFWPTCPDLPTPITISFPLRRDTFLPISAKICQFDCLVMQLNLLVFQ